MRLSLGPWTAERRTGRPYFVDGYRLEPVAWVLRGAKGRVMVPMSGAAHGEAWAEAWVRPVGVRVAEPGGRRYYLSVPRRTPWGVLTGAAIVVALLCWFRRRSRQGQKGWGRCASG